MERFIKRKIIIEENNDALRNDLVCYYNETSYDVGCVSSVREFFRLSDHKAFCLTVVGADLPEKSGLVLVEYLKLNTNVFIIIMMCCNTVDERPSYYTAGADLLLIKLFSCRVLSAILAIYYYRINKKECHEKNTLCYYEETKLIGDIKKEYIVSWELMNNEWLLVTHEGEKIDLTQREYKLLTKLITLIEIAVARN